MVIGAPSGGLAGSIAGAATNGGPGLAGSGGSGGLYGGGGGGGDNSTDTGGAGGQGACRLIWGIGRIYPLSDYSTGSLNHG